MAAQVVQKLPEGDDWIYELKFDGYRALVIKNKQQVELRSRKTKDLAGMYRRIAEAGVGLNADQAVVDGEIVALDAKGSPSFHALQHRGSHPGHQIVFYAFDLLHLDGKDLTAEPLLKRRTRLARVLAGSGLLASQELPGTAAAIIEAVRGLGLEGVIAKRKDSAYEPGERSDAWQKAEAGESAGVRDRRFSSRIERHRCSARRLLRRDRIAVRRQGAGWLRAPSASRGLQGAEAAPYR
jgi:bifunctional non-homologous end joining protein LigD